VPNHRHGATVGKLETCCASVQHLISDDTKYLQRDKGVCHDSLTDPLDAPLGTRQGFRVCYVYASFSMHLTIKVRTSALFIKSAIALHSFQL